MSKTAKILNGILKGMAFLVFVNIALLCIAMAYIMFAPNNYPKPFFLVYSPSEAGSYSMMNGIDTKQPTQVPTPEPTPLPLPGEGVMINMSTKIINLADSAGNKYIRLSVVLEFAPDLPVQEETKKGEEAVDPLVAFEEKINTRMPLMDDIVITLLSTKKYEDLYTADGKEALREEIKKAINSRLPEFKVISVYFTEFVVQ